MEEKPTVKRIFSRDLIWVQNMIKIIYLITLIQIKFRESFRPFAPSVIRERVSDFFDIDRESPYMLLVAPVKKEIRREMTDEEQNRFGLEKLHVVRSIIPAVT